MGILDHPCSEAFNGSLLPSDKMLTCSCGLRGPACPSSASISSMFQPVHRCPHQTCHAGQLTLFSSPASFSCPLIKALISSWLPPLRSLPSLFFHQCMATPVHGNSSPVAVALCLSGIHLFFCLTPPLDLKLLKGTGRSCPSLCPAQCMALAAISICYLRAH